MKFQVIKDSIENILVDGLIVGIYEDMKSLDPSVQSLDSKLGGLISQLIKDKAFRGKEEEILSTFTFNNIPAPRIFLLGLGKKEELKEEQLRRVVAKAVKEVEKVKTKNVAIALPNIYGEIAPQLVGQSIAEGALLGLYKFNKYKTDLKEEVLLEEVYIFNEDEGIRSSLEQGIHIGERLAQGTIIARDMVNEPSNVLTPTEMAQRAQHIAQRHGLEIEILEKEDLEKLGMGSFLGVTKGSEEPPKLIVLKYFGGNKEDEVLGLVGKGLTFDAGGISIKPAQGMDAMKSDMGGAAAVLGAMEVIGSLKPKANVIAVVGACENMPSGSAYKPGDILTTYNGKTVEVLNTDAEGRLVLVDCVTYAIKQGVTKLVDLATLTGACLVALGKTTTGLVANDEGWLKAVEEAAEKAGERVWQLPSFPEYKELIKSDVADLKNIGGRDAGTITAGLFIGEFVEGRPWVHMDIAGTAMADSPRGYIVKGGTGTGVRTLYHLAKSMEK